MDFMDNQLENLDSLNHKRKYAGIVGNQPPAVLAL